MDDQLMEQKQDACPYPSGNPSVCADYDGPVWKGPAPSGPAENNIKKSQKS